MGNDCPLQDELEECDSTSEAIEDAGGIERDDTFLHITKPDGSLAWWKTTLAEGAYYMMRNPDDKHQGKALEIVAKLALAFNNLERTLKDRAELEELRDKVNEILTIRNTEKVI